MQKSKIRVSRFVSYSKKRKSFFLIDVIDFYGRIYHNMK